MMGGLERKTPSELLKHRKYFKLLLNTAESQHAREFIKGLIGFIDHHLTKKIGGEND